jgi:hypothetical protein
MKIPSFVRSDFFSHFLVWIIICAVGIYFRLYPLQTKISGEVNERATVYVISKIREQISQQIDAQSKNLPAQHRDILKRKLFDETIHKDGAKIRETISTVSKTMGNELKAQEPFYLLESDAYYYLDLTENILKTGSISDTFKGSKYLNKRMLAPTGHWEPLNLHPYIGFFLYKTISLFKSDIPLMYAVAFSSLFIFSLSMIPFILTCRLLNCRPMITLTGGLFLCLAPIYVKRSMFGWYDNDPYSLLFSFTILFFLFNALKNIGRKNIQWISAALLIVSMILYTFFWQGWVFLFSLLVIAGIVSIMDAFFIVKNRNLSKVLFYLYGGMTLLIFLGVSLTFGPKDFFTLFQEGWTALKGFLNPQLSIWPDIYISVGELKGISFKELIALIGPSFYFYLTAGGMIALAAETIFKKQHSSRQALIFLSIFAVCSLMIAKGALRFVILSLIPISLCFPLVLQRACQALESISTKRPRSIKFMAGIIVLLLAILPITFIQKTIATLPNPLYNSTWEKSLTALREKTPSESIINTWWPPGHFIKQTAKRRVTFDGATINFPQAYWMANVYLAKTEREALGILRMLNNSGNQAAEFLHEKLGFDISSAVFILEQITQATETDARILLKKIIASPEDTDHLLQLTHSDPPPSYLLVYAEFVENNLQLPFIGNWNFQAVEKINKSPELLKKIPSHKSKEYIEFLWDLAGGSYKYSSPLPQVSRRGNTLIFKDNVTIDLDTMDCHVDSPQFGRGIPQNIYYLDNGAWREKRFEEGKLSYSALLYKEGAQHFTILLDKPLAESMLIRLYFFNGAGLKYFRPVSEESDLTKRTVIKVFEIDWEKFNTDLLKK